MSWCSLLQAVEVGHPAGLAGQELGACPARVTLQHLEAAGWTEHLGCSFCWDRNLVWGELIAQSAIYTQLLLLWKALPCAAIWALEPGAALAWSWWLFGGDSMRGASPPAPGTELGAGSTSPWITGTPKDAQSQAGSTSPWVTGIPKDAQSRQSQAGSKTSICHSPLGAPCWGQSGCHTEPRQGGLEWGNRAGLQHPRAAQPLCTAGDL